MTDTRQQRLIEWPNCTTPDCEFKKCMWSGTDLCYNCFRDKVGIRAVMQRYSDTHPAEKVFLSPDGVICHE